MSNKRLELKNVRQELMRKKQNLPPISASSTQVENIVATQPTGNKMLFPIIGGILLLLIAAGVFVFWKHGDSAKQIITPTSKTKANPVSSTETVAKPKPPRPLEITNPDMYYIPVMDNNGLYRYITLDGKSITESKYARAFMFQEGRALVQNRDSLWGYIDTNGKNVACCYTQGLSFREGVAWVNKNGQLKALNSDGREIATLPENVISVWPFYNGLALFSRDGLQSYMDKNHNVIGNGTYFYDGKRFQENMASVRCDNGKYGYIDTEANFTTSCEYDFTLAFKNSKAIVVKNGRWGAINKQGDFAIGPLDAGDTLISDNDIFRYKRKDGKWGWLNSSGKVMIQPVYQETSNFGNSNIAPVKGDSLWGYVNKNGKLVIDLQYAVAYPFFNNRALAQFTNGQWGTIDENGTVDVVLPYKTISRNYWNLAYFGVQSEPRIMAANPSFNCSNAKNNVQKMICNSVKLATLDKRMGELFKNNKEVAAFQKKFLEDRNECSDVNCLEEIYMKIGS